MALTYLDPTRAVASEAIGREAESVRVLLAADYRPTRVGLRVLLEQQGYSVCAEAADVEGAVDAAGRTRPDICLLDFDDSRTSVAAAERIRAGGVGAAVVVITASSELDDFVAALRAGVSGYLHKAAGIEPLVDALRGVLHGHAILPQALVSRVAERLEQLELRARLVPDGIPLPLTNREKVVLELLGEGLSTAEIAKRLFIAPVTVRSHVSSILRKLGVTDRVAAVRLLSGP